MKRICDFAIENMETIVWIYAIVAAITFVAVNIFFWKISFDLDKEIREEMQECGGCYFDMDEARFGKKLIRATGVVISIPTALIWWSVPLIVGGVMIYDTIQKKNPELCGLKTDDFENKEENK